MPHEEVRQENMQKALDAGIKCLYRDGVTKLQLKSVAEESGLSIISIRRYFGNKDHMVYEILYRQHEIYRQQMEGYFLPYKNGCGLDQLTGLLWDVAHNFEDLEDRILVLAEAHIYLARLPEKGKLTEQYTQLVDSRLSDIISIIERGQKDGSICSSIAADKTTAILLWKSYWGFLQQLAILKRIGVCDGTYLHGILLKYIEDVERLFKSTDS